MSAFPADIVVLAERIAGEMNQSFDAVLVAAALTAERENCAQIADSHGQIAVAEAIRETVHQNGAPVKALERT